MLLLSLVLAAVPVWAARPIANDDRYRVDEDSLDNRLDVLDNDRDPDGDTLTIVAVTQGTIGTVIIIDGGARVSYTPDPEQFGNDSFRYEITDGKGGSDTAQVNVTVTEINDPPVAEDDQAVTNEDTPVTKDVLDNDDDSDGNLDPSTVRRISGPSHGSTSVNASNGEITYSPAQDWHGDDTFTYQVCDDGVPSPVLCDTATVAVTVIEVNDPPIADAGADQTVKTLQLVTLDGTGSYDLEGDLPLQYNWTPSGGLSNPNVVTPTFTTPDDPDVRCFELIVIDARGAADVTPDQVCITVTNRAPIADAGPDQRVPSDSLVRLDGTSSRDIDNDYPLSYLWNQTSGPTVSLSNATVPTPTFTAPDTPSTLAFALYVIDSYNEPDLSPDTVTITVYEPPVFHAYLPSLAHNYAVGPDLVVESIQATRDSVQVVIANQGNAPVENGFFVDVYINPFTPPTRVNQTWLDVAGQGLVWGVVGSGVNALVPGNSLTLRYQGDYYLADFSSFSGSLTPGTPIYAQVDSFNSPDTGYGTVLETHEMLGAAYNNIRGPVSSTAASSGSSLSLHPTDPGGNGPGLRQGPISGTLPERP